MRNDSHSVLFGYVLWILGPFGAYRYYYGKPWTGVLWTFTLGLLFIGWIIDLFLIPSMDDRADGRYREGRISYTVAWILCGFPFFGALGLHRLYLGKWFSGLLWLVLALTSLITFPPIALVFFLIWVFDLFTLNEQIDEINGESAGVPA